LDAPGEVLREVRAFGHAFSTSQRDTADTGAVDWIAGDTLVADWAPEPDSSAASGASRLRRITARGGARALTHLSPQGDSAAAGPSLNYSRGAVIDIALRGDRIDRVLVTGAADGVHLEPLPPAADSTAKRPPPRRLPLRPPAPTGSPACSRRAIPRCRSRRPRSRASPTTTAGRASATWQSP